MCLGAKSIEELCPDCLAEWEEAQESVQHYQSQIETLEGEEYPGQFDDLRRELKNEG